MSTTSIEWTQAVWNPTKGCDRVSPGCDHCYAMTMAKRLKGMGQAAYQQDGDPRTSGPGFLAHEWPASLTWPLTVKTPKRIFVNSMSDLFHDRISTDYIALVFAVMAEAKQHTFQLLTKRHARMRSLLSDLAFVTLVHDKVKPHRIAALDSLRWPLPNVWLGVSVENQQWADIRIPALLDTPAAVRFLSCEPLLGPVCLDPWHTPHDDGRPACGGPPAAGLHWVIAGGESGPGARPMHPDWARSLRDQCVAGEMPFLFKQHGEWAAYEEDAQPPFWNGQDGQIIDGHCLPDDLTEHEVTNGWWLPDLDGPVFRRVGKHRAGRTLDGRTWDEYPELVTA